MRHLNSILLCTALALLFVIAGCTKAADVSGAWAGSATGQNAGRTGTSDVQADLQGTRRGLTGTLTWHNTTGPWGLMEGNTLTIPNGTVSGNKVSFSANQNLPGGTVMMTFKGTVEGTTLKGTADLTVGSVMGGDTYLGNMELTKK